MIKRIVKMTFRPDAVPAFLAIFEESKLNIRAFEGNLHLELLRDLHQPNVLFTLSFWESEAALEAYRRSELFKTTWAKTKALFLEKPEAWSVEVVEVLPAVEVPDEFPLCGTLLKYENPFDPVAEDDWEVLAGT